MTENFLEQLVAEWYEFQGYFVRRNIRVGKRRNGGHEGELDVVAFHPEKMHLVHIEPSMDCNPWEKREKRFRKKFEAGRRHIPGLFHGLRLPNDIEQIALLMYGSSKSRSTLGGGKLIMVDRFMSEIRTDISHREIRNAAIPEQFIILRSLQYAAHYWRTAT